MVTGWSDTTNWCGTENICKVEIVEKGLYIERNQDFVFVFHSTAIVVGLEGLNIGKILRHFPDKK